MNEKDFLKKLGLKIQIVRKGKNLSQQYLADKTATDRGYLSNIENGKANPTIGYLLELALALEVDIREFFDFTI